MRVFLVEFEFGNASTWWVAAAGSRAPPRGLEVEAMGQYCDRPRGQSRGARGGSELVAGALAASAPPYALV
jgi:hypothetical protein